ncbi:LOW QUALITY PROTEIN: BAG family molecular chaperone regulator 5-like [Thalassophryne amazonica]|uniref:LOW QUALITY PROTEIN: BAG family molecular chaperone regulator 5-like n=1 Tax=Thalassophryne amazonica TaxID=390379 RepID=UPI001470E14B|nr:LOW QUALITY PROTEIN: BAG family molecular chaperone regulator 5-like [Thalassophryne amazonica]
MAVRWLCSLFGKPFDGGKRMDHGSPGQQQQHHLVEQQQQMYQPQHPAMMHLVEIQKEVASLGPQVWTFSGLQNDREYKRLERELTRLLLEVDQVDTEGKPDLQGARKHAAQEVDRLLRYMEDNATHPSRVTIEDLSHATQQLVDEHVVAPQRAGRVVEITDEFVDALQELILRLTQVKTEGRVPLRKARYRALTRLCAVQDVIEGRTQQQALSLPLSGDTHESVNHINQVMVKVSVARSQLVALLMGLSGRDSCAHLSRILTEMQVELDALDVSGNAAIRNYRKQVVEEINGLLKHLDLEGEGDDTRRYDLAQNNSIREIEAVRAHVSHLREGVLRHCAVGDLSFRPKAELQSLLLHLDQVDTAKNPCIREARRRAVVEVQAVMTFLDLREALVCRHPFPNEHPSHRAVWMVLGSLSDLQAQVLGFDGKRVDRSYMMLEELLTKQLLALDAVDPQGEATKVARKQAVKFAQNILNYLDMKTDEWEY